MYIIHEAYFFLGLYIIHHIYNLNGVPSRFAILTKIREITIFLPHWVYKSIVSEIKSFSVLLDIKVLSGSSGL